MAHTKFDIEDALPRLADATPPPPLGIPILVEDEVHEHPAPPPEPEGPQPGVGARQPDGEPDLARDLDEFREAEHRRICGGVPSQVMNLNRRQRIIPELNAEDYIDSEPDEEYLQDDEEDDEEDDEINEEDLRMPEDPEFPPPADDLSQNTDSGPDLQMQPEADDSEVVQIDRRAEKPCLQTLEVFIKVEEVGQVQLHWNSVLPGTPSVNGPMSVQAELTLTDSPAPVLTLGAPNDPTPTIMEESHTTEIIMQTVNPSSSGIDVRTLGASPTPTSLLPGTSQCTVLRFCTSCLELPISAATERISGGEPVQKPPANASILSEGEPVPKPPAHASISEGESLLKTSCLKSPSAV